MAYQSYHSGKLAEDFAVGYLEARGYEILERNFHSHFGEIDVIAKDGAMLIFVEVRMRQAADEIHPLETISRGKQHRLIKTAQMYLAKTNPDCLQCRFDVVAISEDKGNRTIEIFHNMIEGG